MAAHDAERFLRPALESVLRQTISDLELVVVDDGSRDRTSAILAAVSDARLVVLTNREQQGLAASLNRALEAARGRYVARLDADDVALPHRLERQLRRLGRGPALGIVGSGILEIDAAGRPAGLHVMPRSPAEVRWASLFSSPFYHPTVLVDRDLLEEHDLRYDTTFPESEDYELWTRLLAVADGANLEEALVLYRLHPGQATERRRDLQRSYQRRVALREMSALAPELPRERLELAWAFGAHEPVEAGRLEEAAEALLELHACFEERVARSSDVRRSVGRLLARRAREGAGAASIRLARHALALDPALPLHALARRRRRRVLARSAGRQAASALARRVAAGGSADPIRVVVVSPEPAPYRAPLFDLIDARPELDLTVVYAAHTLAGRTWDVELRHRSVFLPGARVPGARRLLHHDYAISRGVGRALRELRPQVVVVAGWSTYACQAAMVWCRRHRVPYVLQVESHDEGPRAGWRKAVKGAVVPRSVRGSASVLVTGTLVRRSMLERGADPDRLGLFAVTVDVEEFGRRAAELLPRRDELRTGLGVSAGDVAVLSVARLAPEKGLDTLVRAVGEAGDRRLVLVVAGDGPERTSLERVAREEGVRLVFAGDRPWDRIVEVYVAADVFALLSEREPWGVVVNEAAACGLPLVLTDRVGAAHDLLRDGENGALVRAGDVTAAAHALRLLAEDEGLRRAFGARSREIVGKWGYEPSVDAFVRAALRAAEGT